MTIVYKSEDGERSYVLLNVHNEIDPFTHNTVTRGWYIKGLFDGKFYYLDRENNVWLNGFRRDVIVSSEEILDEDLKEDEDKTDDLDKVYKLVKELNQRISTYAKSDKDDNRFKLLSEKVSEIREILEELVDE